MTTSFPYRSQMYSQVKARPQTMLATMYTPAGGGFSSYAKKYVMTAIPKKPPSACMNMIMTGDCNG